MKYDIYLRIKELRKEKKLTQIEFSTLINLDNSQFSKIEQGKLMPTLTQLLEISSKFNKSMDWLCFGKENNSKGEIPSELLEILENRRELIETQKKYITALEDQLNSKKIYPAHENPLAAVAEPKQKLIKKER